MTVRERRLLIAAKIALAAYRGIFGRSCWNAFDRRAFAILEGEIDRSTGKDREGKSR